MAGSESQLLGEQRRESRAARLPFVLTNARWRAIWSPCWES